MSSGLEMFILMGVILKVPIAAACWLIWYAVRAEPEPVEDAPGEEDHDRRHFRRDPTPKRPRSPRRGPHSPDALPVPCPEEGGLRVVRHPASIGQATGSARERG